METLQDYLTAQYGEFEATNTFWSTVQVMIDEALQQTPGIDASDIIPELFKPFIPSEKFFQEMYKRFYDQARMYPYYATVEGSRITSGAYSLVANLHRFYLNELKK